MSPCFSEFIKENNKEFLLLKTIICGYMTKLEENISKKFQIMNKIAYMIQVRLLFLNSISLNEKEQLIDVSSDDRLDIQVSDLPNILVID